MNLPQPYDTLYFLALGHVTAVVGQSALTVLFVYLESAAVDILL